MKALIYARVSTTNQADGTSLESQVRECVRYAKEKGFEIAHIAQEVYSGAYLFEREILSRERDLIRQNKYNAVIAYSVDRLSRDQAHLLILWNEFKRFNTELLFATETLDDTPQGKLLLSVNSYVAEIEREKIRERTMRGKRTKLLQGKFVPAGDLFGYTFNRETGKREIVEEEAEVVRDIFNRIVSGESLRRIIRHLNDSVPPPSLNKRKFKHDRLAMWGDSTLRRIALEPAYAGRTFTNRFKRDSYYKNGKTVSKIISRPESEWIELSDITPAIISLDLFNLAQKKLSENKGELVRNESMPYLLRGLFFCGVCGKRMYADQDKGRRIYRCSSRRFVRCGGGQMSANWIEKEVWKIVLKIIQNPKQIERNFERYQKRTGGQKQKIERKLMEYKSENKRLAQEIETMVTRSAVVDNETWKMFEKQIKEKQLRRGELEKKIIEFENLLKGDVEKHFDLLRRIGDFQEKIIEADFELQRKILEAFNIKVFGNVRSFDLYADWVY